MSTPDRPGRVDAQTRRERRQERLIADLTAHALAGDTQAARITVGRLLEGTRDGLLLTESLAGTLAKVASDFDTMPRQQLAPRRMAGVRRGTETEAPVDLVSITHPTLPLLVLPADVEARLGSLVDERNRAGALADVGLTPTAKVLLTGPPGVGKTLTAQWLAATMHLPLARVEPALVMSSLLGESARNLRQALAWARKNPSVFLIDEFDAFAKRRDDHSDVGELKRLVNMLLLELDQWPSSTLLVAATNHPQLLDPAMQRRFDVTLQLPVPDTAARLHLINGTLAQHRQKVSTSIAQLAAAVTEGRSGSDIRQLIVGALRSAIVADRPLEDLLIDELRPGGVTGKELARQRALFSAVAHDQAGMSNRTIAGLLSLSNSTVSDYVRRGRLMLDDARLETEWPK